MGLSLSAKHLRVQLPTGNTGVEATRSLLDIRALTVGSGESVAIYGPSGSGKTTLLHLLVGLQRSSGSSVLWRDAQGKQQDIAVLPDGAHEAWRLENAGLVFQQFQLFGQMTALENVLTPFRFRHWRCPPKGLVRARKLLSDFGIDGSAPTGWLSRGEQQRVAIARALVCEPAVILADEPTASLDPVSASLVMDTLLQQCSQLGVTLIVATHDSAFAPRFQRALALQNGQLAPVNAHRTATA